MTPKENYKKHTMKKLIVATLLLGSGTLLSAQKTAKIPAYYKPAKSEMYHKGWIDFNKTVSKIYMKTLPQHSMPALKTSCSR